MPLQITLGELLHQLAHEHMHRPAITMAESGETISYIQFERLVNRVAHGFQSLPRTPTGNVEKARLAEAHSRHAAGHMPHPSP
ncbi:MAG: hypothetical protein CMN36_06130 [SAR116 cluster bacterium]|nr:hypothetical protein [SAR116 cluster bacterium]|tara:strand:- start:124 stop:372 length:249 start_codon:yes stop_codon:yes gene_type:complete